jgi:ribonuclease P protein component
LKQIQYDETSISTVENPPETAARLSCPQLQQKWASNSGEPASRRAQAFDAGVMRRAMSGQPAASLLLPRRARIKAARDFARARTQGKRIACGCLILNWLPATSTRVGIITGRKLGNAVMRSRARRLLREGFRLHQHELAQPVEVILVARESIRGKPYHAVERDFLSALRQAHLLKKTL